MAGLRSVFMDGFVWFDRSRMMLRSFERWLIPALLRCCFWEGLLPVVASGSGPG